jgi:hypothetical protein
MANFKNKVSENLRPFALSRVEMQRQQQEKLPPLAAEATPRVITIIVIIDMPLSLIAARLSSHSLFHSFAAIIYELQGSQQIKIDDLEMCVNLGFSISRRCRFHLAIAHIREREKKFFFECMSREIIVAVHYWKISIPTA